MHERRNDLTLVAIFLVIVTTPLFFTLLWAGGRATARVENRVLQPWPELPTSAEALRSFPVRFHHAFEDRFALRAELTAIYSQVLYRGFGVAPFGKVRIRRDGWVFEDIPGAETCDKQMLPAATLDKMAAQLNLARESAHALGANYLVVLVPGKSTIYRPEEPERACPWQQTSNAALVARLRRMDPKFPVIDLYSTLVRAKRKKRVFYLDDPHWNDNGAMAAYPDIVRAANALLPVPPALPLAAFQERHVKHASGALARFANLSLRESVDPYFEVENPKAQQTEPPAAARVPFSYQGSRDIVFTHSDRSLPRALIFRDSFFEPLRGWLAEHFSETRYVWSTFVAAKVSAARPNLVIEQRSLWARRSTVLSEVTAQRSPDAPDH